MKFAMNITIVTDAETPEEAKKNFVEAQDLLLRTDNWLARIYGISTQEPYEYEGDD